MATALQPLAHLLLLLGVEAVVEVAEGGEHLRAVALGGLQLLVQQLLRLAAVELVTGDQRRTVAGFNKEVTSLAFVANTPRVLASSGDQTVKLVNVDDGKTERSFSGPTDFMYSTGVSADGKRVISGGQASTLFEWLVDDGQLLRSLAAPKVEAAQPQTAQATGG